MVMDEFERARGLARENPRNIVAVINHSGGKDSMRMLGLVREEFPEMPMISVMADTGSR
jgi:3'-phosphoadenosine 5'-phosphosulfate sulfotransferase (PAPS reductase)/FAD synthetase